MPLLLVGLGGLGLGSVFGFGLSKGLNKIALVMLLMLVAYAAYKNGWV
ncbi:hypothetical protein AB2S62_21735 [Vibrio sp. NTOU-M3]